MKDNCLTYLSYLHQPGGFSEEGITVNFTQNGMYEEQGILKGKVENLPLDYSKLYFDGDCLEPGCIEESGVWTTAITTSYTNGTEFFFKGPVDSAGNVYVVDIGVFYPACNQISIRQNNIPLNYINNFTSIDPLPIGTKIVRVKKITPTSIVNVYTYIGPYKNKDTLTRSTNKINLLYNYLDQKCDVEDIALAVINLITSSYYRKYDYQIVFRDDFYLDPLSTKVIEDNLQRLSRLIDRNISSRRLNSIPAFPATYTEPEDIYGEKVSHLYIEPGCFEDGCFSFEEEKTQISIEVINRYVAWLLYAYATYSIVYRTNKYDEEISRLALYLESQINTSIYLVKKGWTDDIDYQASVPIEEYTSSTTVATILAFLKVYEYTQSNYYLSIAASLYQSLLDRLYNPFTKILSQSYTDNTVSNESVIYSLLLFNSIKSFDAVESITGYISSRVKPINSIGTVTYVLDSNNQFVLTEDNNKVFTIGSYDITNISNYSYLLPIGTDVLDTVNISKLNSILIQLARSIILSRLSFKQTPEEYHYIFSSLLFVNSESVNLSYVAECLSNNFIDSEYSKIFSWREFLDLLYQRTFTQSTVKSMWPIDYEWASEIALSNSGSLGKLNIALSNILANLPASNDAIKNYIYLQSANQNNLDMLGEDINVVRYHREIDSHYKDRIEFTKSGEANDFDSINKSASLLEVEVDSIKESYTDILSTISPIDNSGNYYWGEGYFQGDKKVSNHIDVNINQIIPKSVVDDINRVKAAGIDVSYIGKLSIPAANPHSLEVCAIDSVERQVIPPTPILEFFSAGTNNNISVLRMNRELTIDDEFLTTILGSSDFSPNIATGAQFFTNPVAPGRYLVFLSQYGEPVDGVFFTDNPNATLTRVSVRIGGAGRFMAILDMTGLAGQVVRVYGIESSRYNANNYIWVKGNNYVSVTNPIGTNINIATNFSSVTEITRSPSYYIAVEIGQSGAFSFPYFIATRATIPSLAYNVLGVFPFNTTAAATQQRNALVVRIFTNSQPTFIWANI